MSTLPLQLPSDDAASPHGVPPASGPAFPATVKALATALMAALLISGSMALSGVPRATTAPTAGAWVAAAAIVAVIVTGYWSVLTSRTSCDGVRIEQTGPWRRSVEIAEITRVVLVRVRGLEGLVVPRLVVRTKRGLATFHAGDPSVLARFEALVGNGPGA